MSGNITVGISDHIPQFALIRKTSKDKSTMNKKVTDSYIRKYKDINTDSFCRDLNRIDWDKSNLEDANQYGKNFLNVFNQVLDIHAPLTKTKPSKQQTKRNAKPWIKNDILKLESKTKHINDS